MPTPRTPYERLAHVYDMDRAHWVVRPDEIIASLLEAGRVTVLDVGCGTAIYLNAQREHFPSGDLRLVGVDASRAMLAQAAAKGGQVALAEGRAEHLPIAEAVVDYAYASFAFHHFEDKDAALDEVARVVREGGAFRIRNMDPWSQPDWWLYAYFDGTWELDQRRFWPSDRIGAELERRGFSVDIECQSIDTSRTAEDVLEEAERRVISQLAIMDDDAFEAGLRRLRALGPDEPVVYERGRLTLTARKLRP